METGGSGFRGSHLVEELERRSDDVELFLPRSAEDDRRDTSDIEQGSEVSSADDVVHLAAAVDGIGTAARIPGDTSTTR
jgi:dTDP-glucose 4,6-dehydratase/GDP-L-fucose synthase